MKYYYTDPLKAVWMSDKFGVRFLHYPTPEQASEYESEEPWDWLHTSLYAWQFEEMIGDAIKCIKEASPDRIYVHPDDYGVFEPKGRDIILDDDRQPRELGKVDSCRVFWESDENTEWCYSKDIQIIQRNETAFFMPEVEA